LEIAGAFVFLTYLTMPALTAVRGPEGLPRSTLDGMAERTFLLRLLGLSAEPSWTGGIANPRVRRLAEAVAERHSGMPGMRQEYMDVIGSLIAVAPLRTRAELGRPPSPGEVPRYWRYMSAVLSLMGIQLRSSAGAEEKCQVFVEEHAEFSADGQAMISSFAQRHPRYVTSALPVLFPASRSVVEAALVDSGAVHG
jgi:hypothetical protein